ncbi:MAG: hypothetical protein E6L09_13175 [Verrucomicrobia bacterium]|nr:MAG: hypothetical protein E6L09_13175 [Verrucomicrobiota bacterium]
MGDSDRVVKQRAHGQVVDAEAVHQANAAVAVVDQIGQTGLDVVVAFAQDGADLGVPGCTEESEAEVVSAGDFGRRIRGLRMKPPEGEVIVAGFAQLEFALQRVSSDAVARR